MSTSNTNTTISTLSKGWKKKATQLYPAFKMMTEELGWLYDLSDEDITVSGRENLIPLDIARVNNTHYVSDGGAEGRTYTPAMNEGSFDFSELNDRFFISTRARMLDTKAREAMIIRDVKYRSKKALQSLARRVGYNFYGYSTGIVAETTTNASSATLTLTLDDGFGDSTIATASYLANLFEVNDRIALLDASNSNALFNFGTVSSISSSVPHVVAVFDAAVDVDSGDNIVFGNGVGAIDDTITATDYNKWQPGLLDVVKSATLHSLATSAEPRWAAVNNTDGGRFGRAKLKYARQQIQNRGGGKLTDIIWSNGVENDVEAGEAAGRIYDSSSFDLDQSVKAKGVTFRTSELVPPGHVFAYDKSAWHKKLLTDRINPETGMIDFGDEDMDKAEDRAGWKAGFRFAFALVCNNRGKFVGFSGLTES